MKARNLLSILGALLIAGCASYHPRTRAVLRMEFSANFWPAAGWVVAVREDGVVSCRGARCASRLTAAEMQRLRDRIDSIAPQGSSRIPTPGEDADTFAIFVDWAAAGSVVIDVPPEGWCSQPTEGWSELWREAMKVMRVRPDQGQGLCICSKHCGDAP